MPIVMKVLGINQFGWQTAALAANEDTPDHTFPPKSIKAVPEGL
jgi:hypothetical protein